MQHVNVMRISAKNVSLEPMTSPDRLYRNGTHFRTSTLLLYPTIQSFLHAESLGTLTASCGYSALCRLLYTVGGLTWHISWQSKIYKDHAFVLSNTRFCGHSLSATTLLTTTLLPKSTSRQRTWQVSAPMPTKALEHGSTSSSTTPKPSALAIELSALAKVSLTDPASS